jgi:arylformamidase
MKCQREETVRTPQSKAQVSTAGRKLRFLCLPGAYSPVSGPNGNPENHKAPMAHPKRFELLTPRFVVWCSIQLSYGCVGRASLAGPRADGKAFAAPDLAARSRRARVAGMINRRSALGLAAALVAPPAIGQNRPPGAATTVRYAVRPGAAANLTSLDLYSAPPGPKPAGLMVFIHGGGWRIGDKADPAAGADKARVFNAAGLAFASVNYRLSPEVRHPAHIADVAAALAWLIGNAARIGVDPARVFVIGHSAGAHLAALLGCDRRWLAAHGLGLHALRGVILLDGAGYDMEAAFARLPASDSMTAEMYRAAFGADPAGWRDASPIRQIAPGAGIAPFLIAHTDGAAARSQARALAGRLRASGVEARLLRAAGSSHANINRRFGAPGDTIAPAVLAAVARWSVDGG